MEPAGDIEMTAKEEKRECQKIILVSAGASHSAALLESDVVCTWGQGEDGQLGTGDAADRFVPAPVSSLVGHQVVSVICGADHTIAYSNARKQVYSWGWGDFGRLGHGNSSDMLIPRPIEYFEGVKIKQIACGDCHCLAITGEGEVASWGRNQNGQLGLGTQEDSPIPQKIDVFKKISVKMVAAGAEHSAAVTDDGDMYGWGWGRYGNLGHGDRFDRLFPTKVSSNDGNKMKLVACGWRHTIWVTRSGALFTNGWNKYGQLGHGDYEDHLVPDRLEEMRSHHVSQISGGWRHTMAVTATGSLYGWGWNKFGQVGIGHTVNCNSPVRITFPDRQRAVQVCCGWRHTLVITDGDNVYSWGRCTNGQLGLGHANDQNAPTIIQPLSRYGRIESSSNASSSGVRPSDRYRAVPDASSSGEGDEDISVPDPKRTEILRGEEKSV